jgi:hypothetical protein
MNTTPAGNEAELQWSLVARVRAALPLLPANIKLERFLQLRVGHQALKIDGTALEPGVVRGRYDVLDVHFINLWAVEFGAGQLGWPR